MIERLDTENKFRVAITPQNALSITSGSVTKRPCNYKKFGDIPIAILNDLSQRTGLTFEELSKKYWAVDFGAAASSHIAFIKHGNSFFSMAQFDNKTNFRNREMSLSNIQSINHINMTMGLSFANNMLASTPFPEHIYASASTTHVDTGQNELNNLIFKYSNHTYYGVTEPKKELIVFYDSPTFYANTIKNYIIPFDFPLFDNYLSKIDNGLEITGDLEVPLKPDLVNDIYPELARMNDNIKRLNQEKVFDAYVKEITGAIDNQTAVNQTFFQGIYNKVLDFLQKILDAILSLPQLLINIANAIKNFVLPIPLAMSEFWTSLLDKLDLIVTTLSGLSVGEVGDIILDYVWSIPQSMSDFWQNVLDWLSGIKTSILELPENFMIKFKIFIHDLFVPDAVVLKNLFDDFKAKFESKTGLLTYPMVFLASFVALVVGSTPSDAILHFPELKNPVTKEVFFQGVDYNVSQAFRDMGQIYDYYLLAVNVFFIGLVLTLCGKKLNSIIRS